MSSDPGKQISDRKKDHIKLNLTDKVAFRSKSNGFENYDFIHDASTEVEYEKINFRTKVFGKKTGYPFLISCMTGGTPEAEGINAKLAEAAAELNIAIGLGSQRQAIENDLYLRSYKVIREKAGKVPLFGNIGAAQIVQLKDFGIIEKLAESVGADAMVVHVNPAQELMQPEGDLNFKGFGKKLTKLVRTLSVPVIVKEVGAGISDEAAHRFLEAGVTGIDVAGAGGTSWTGIEMLRSNSEEDPTFWDWGNPTSFCIKNVARLKKNYKFVLIGSGGINSASDAAKAFALGADLAASARIILKTLHNGGPEEVINLIKGWFDVIKKIMFLTGSQNLNDLKNNKIIIKKDFF